MAIANNLYKETNEKYGRGVALNEHNDTISIVSANRGKDGNIYMEWVYPSKYEDGKSVPKDKVIPMKIELGNGKKQALDTLRFIAGLINDLNTYTPMNEPQGNMADDDIPF